MRTLNLMVGIIGILLMAIVAHAAEKTVAWDSVDGAVGYRLSTSTDNGATWEPATPSPEIIAPTTQAVVTVPDGVLVLIRASAYNNIGEALNTTAGVWFNSAWQISSAPVGLRTPGE